MGADAGDQLERRSTQVAQETNLPVLGPNCTELVYPKLGLRHLRERHAGKAERSEGDCQPWLVSIIACTLPTMCEHVLECPAGQG